jgi:hypothetical protein
MSNEVPLKNLVEENDDLIELNSIEEPSICMESGKKKVQKRRKTSEVWNYFDHLPSTGQPDDKLRAKCKACGATYIAESSYGTGNLRNHIKKCPLSSTRDIGQMFISANERSMSVSASKFCPKRFRELLVASVIKHDLPFRYVEYDGVRETMKYLRSDVPVISRNTAKADVIKLHLREKQMVKSMLDVCPGRICLTSDLWTSLTTDGYMCLTAHFVDKDWVLHKRVLNFSFMPPPHNGISLCEKMYNLLQEWGIETKVFSITLDNASANDVAADLLRQQLNIKRALVCFGEFFHLRCCAHILNLIVQDGLKEIETALQKIRDSVKYVRGSQVRKQRFLQAVNQMSLDNKKGLRQDVPTRWNSTYLMLESAIHFRRAFSYLEMTDSNFKHCPTALEWEKVNDISTFLACFYTATCEFSGTKYPTANLYFPAVSTIYVTLKEQLESEDVYKRSMATQMLSKFEKYWSEFSVVLAIAVILDPRFKLNFVNYIYMRLYGVLESREYLHVREKLFSLFTEYNGSSSTTPSPTTITAEKHVHSQQSSKSSSELMKVK